MPNPSKRQLNNFIRYSSMAFQMGVIVFGSAFGGVKLDQYLKHHHIVEVAFPIFTFSFTILGVAIAMYFFIKDLFKKT